MDFDFVGKFVVVSHGPDGLAYGTETAPITETYTNVAAGKTIICALNGVNRDLKVTDNSVGTLTVITLNTGSWKFTGPDGKLLFNDPGQVRIQTRFDDNGTPRDPFDDEVISSRIVRESTGRNDLHGQEMQTFVVF